eukprot:4639865-Pleurochrysis_carterae.AAC.1
MGRLESHVAKKYTRCVTDRRRRSIFKRNLTVKLEIKPSSSLQSEKVIQLQPRGVTHPTWSRPTQ